MFKKRKKVVVIFLLFFLGLGGYFGYRYYAGKKAKEEIKTSRVKKKDLVKFVTASGEIAALKEVSLKFQTSGQLTWVGVAKGDKVEAGQAIAQLDTRELELNLKKELKDYMNERWDFEEDRQVTYRDSVMTDTVIRILEKNQFDLDKAVMDVEIKDIALKFATLITPIKGVVTYIDTPVAGVNITPATAVFKVADPDSLVFQAEVDEIDIGKVEKGQKVNLYLDAYPNKELRGKVEKISFSATTTTGGGTAYLVDISLPKDEEYNYRIGMNGDSDIILEEKEDCLVLDYQALKKEKGKFYVEVLKKDGKIEKRRVEVGLETDTKVEIKKGLEKGERVVVSG